jgi:hypothetical protein
MDPETDETNAVDPVQGQIETDASGEPDLNSLLQQYEEGTKPKATAPQPDLSKLEPVIRFAEAEMATRQKETFENDVNSAVETIGEDESFKALPKTLTRRMLVAYAFDNPAFDKAFQNKASDPTGWDAALSTAKATLAEEIKELPLQKGSRDDIEAAVATVQDTGPADENTGPNVAKMAKMSDFEWQQFLEEELAKES